MRYSSSLESMSEEVRLLGGLSFRKIVGVLLGTVVEYYDYSLYGFCPLILAQHFLPLSDPAVKMVAAFGVYAAGYFSKPLGSFVFGWIGDQLGRKAALHITILGIAFPTTVIGLLPSYQQMGWVVAMILVACRFLQGVFVAGEYDGAALYVMEHAGWKKSALSASLVRATGVLGLLLGSLMVAVCTYADQHYPGLWRLPFLMSFPLALVTFWLRRTLVETPEFKNFLKQKDQVGKSSTQKPTALRDLLKSAWQPILWVFLLCGTMGGTYQLSLVFFKTYLPLVFPALASWEDWLHPWVLLTFGGAMPLFGLWASRSETTRVMKRGIEVAFLGACCLGLALQWQIVWLAFFAQFVLAIGLAPFNSLSHALAYSLFPVETRYRGLSLGHTFGSLVFSGTAPSLGALLWKELKQPVAPVCYLLVLLCLGYGVISRLEQQKKEMLYRNP